MRGFKISLCTMVTTKILLKYNLGREREIAPNVKLRALHQQKKWDFFLYSRTILVEQELSVRNKQRAFYIAQLLVLFAIVALTSFGNHPFK